MAGLINKFLVSASLAAGMTAMVAAPVLAQNFRIEGEDHILYDARDTTGDRLVDQTYENSSANIDDILRRLDGTPGGNIELFSSSHINDATYRYRVGRQWHEWKYNSSFYGGVRTSLIGEVNGKTLTISSLNSSDWFGSDGTTAYGNDDLANRWFGQLLDNYQPDLGRIGRQTAFNTFLGMYGFERASDPNISYIESDRNGIEIGLAGHMDLGNVYGDWFAGWQASEVLRYEYDGVVDYLWSFSATATGLTEYTDGTSHNGLYKVFIPTGDVPSVPEPSTMLGLMAVGGLFAASSRKSRKNS
ncbi:NF038130 family PEP-CTERM protein [Limnospira fusiformis KN01]|uniref:NF038130 family PEP-CTERM protein n=1 Tax=Limnospira TaxID=2596745 RepID=UPI0016588194|nr:MULTISPECIES: NF038130 family PEP-CTERM protein [Limnospira]MDT9201044.1 NF038130 family PEP-CTERM protein [Limnospira sp. PMC 1042.18]ULB44601.1 NF038130 family PEP-CTERM protein [Limnospira fusiformis KN01]